MICIVGNLLFLMSASSRRRTLAASGRSDAPKLPVGFRRFQVEQREAGMPALGMNIISQSHDFLDKAGFLR